MSFKVTALLGGLFAALLAFVFLYERPRMVSEREAADKAIIDLENQVLSKLILTNKAGHFVAEKRGNEWVLVEPVETPADWAQFESIVAAAKEVDRGRVVVDSLAYMSGEVDLSAYGLKPPRVELRCISDSEDEIWLFFGNDNPVGKAAYLSWSGGHQVVLTQRYQRDQFQKSLLELRDRRMLPFDPDEIVQIKIERPDSVTVVNRSGFLWEIVAPFKKRAEAAIVNSMLTNLKSEQIDSVVAESVDNPARYGLDAPEYRVVLGRKESLPDQTLLLGKKVPHNRKGLWYGRYMARPYVFTVKPDIVDEVLSAPPSALRYRHVFEFERAGIDHIELAFSDSSVVCQKSPDGNWSVLQPADHRIESRDVENWIDFVRNLRVRSFMGEAASLDEFGLAEPSLVISFWRKGQLVREVSVGQHDAKWFGKRRDSDEVFGLSFNASRHLFLRVNPQFESQNQEAGAGA